MATTATVLLGTTRKAGWAGSEKVIKSAMLNLKESMIKKFLFSLATVSILFVLAPLPAYASHSWGNYHWARTANPFTLKLGDNMSSNWDPYLATSSSDWSLSSILDTSIVSGGTTAKKCRATTGRVEVCNATYGRNGWLGMARIWITGAHITKGAVKVNDTYFKAAKYNTPAWRNSVLCQETGHTLGLDHQDEDFYNPPLGTCMDYSLDPTLNQHPNQHDYDQLELIYAHLDSTSTVGQTKLQKGLQTEPGDTPNSWGKLVRKHGKSAVYELNQKGGGKIVTFVILS